MLERTGINKEDIKKAFGMAWPAMLESFFIAFAGLVDSLMVSSLGAASVAAVGLTTQPKFMGLAIFIAGNVSISALVARRKGQGNREGANRIFATFFLMIILLGILISAALVIFANPIIEFCGSEPETHDSAVLYFRIIMGCSIFNIIQMGVNSAQRGSGNTKITMRTNLVSNTVNVIFNYLLIGGHFGFPAWGIKGAAIATVLGTVVSCVMSLLSIRKMDTFVSIPYIFKNKIKPVWEAVKDIVKVGYSVFAEQLLIRIGFMATAIMAAKEGTDALAAHQVGMNLLGLSFSFGDGLSATAVALIGYSLGAQQPQKAKDYGKACRMIGATISVIVAISYFATAAWMMGLFFPKDPHIAKLGVEIVYIIILVVIFQISQVIYMGCLRGAGDTAYTAFVSTISVTVFRTGASYLFCYGFRLGVIGIWLGILTDQVIRYIMASTRFKKGRWTEIKI